MTNNATRNVRGVEDGHYRFHLVDLMRGDSLELTISNETTVTITRTGPYHSEGNRTRGVTLTSTDPNGPRIDEVQSTSESWVSVMLAVDPKLVVFKYDKAIAMLTVKSIRYVPAPARN